MLVRGDFVSISEAKRKADAKYKATKRKQIVLNISIEEDKAIKDYCNQRGLQVATWIKCLIRDAMQGDV